MVLFGVDSVKDLIRIRVELMLLIPLCIPAPGQRFTSLRAGFCWSWEVMLASPLWILPTLGTGPTLLQLLAHQRYYLSSLLCNTLRTLAEHKSMQVVSYDVNSVNVLFIFRPSLATCHWVLWFAWSWWTACEFSGQIWSIALNFRGCFPLRFLLSLPWQAFLRLAAERKELGGRFSSGSLS